MKNPNKKIAVISGGTGYLGREVAKKLAEDGFVIALLYRDSSAENEAQKIIQSLPGSSHQKYICDLKNRVLVQKTLDIIEKTGEIFAAIHTAGVKSPRKKILNSTPEELEEALISNVIPGFNFLSIAAEKLRMHKNGVLIGITTLGVIIPEETKSLGGYIPAKYALQGILTMLHEELKSLNIRVYSLAPGFMEGGMNSDIPRAFVEMIRLKNQGRLTIKEDVALKISYLCQDDCQDTELTHIIAKENL